MDAAVYHIVPLGTRKRLVVQTLEVELVADKIVTGGAVEARDLNPYLCRHRVHCGPEEIAAGSVLLLTNSAAACMLSSGAIERMELEQISPGRSTGKARKAEPAETPG